MKKTTIFLKIIYTLFIIITMLIIMKNYTYAVGISVPSNLSDIYSSTDPTIGTIAGKVLWILQIIFNGCAVIILMLAGVKYMAAAPEAKAEIKKKTIYMATGAVMLFAASGIVSILANLAKNNIK